jgi:hypothetical protein
VCVDPGQRVLLVRTHEPAAARYVGREDGREATLEPLLDYSITLSARASSEECISIPSNFAVLRLMLNSNLVG